MNGNNRYLLDTNAVISLLKGNDKLLAEVQSASTLAISIISKLEFLCFPGLKDSDKALFEAFTERVDVLGLTQEEKPLLAEVIRLRSSSSLKLPDAIIAATAQTKGFTLITADKALLKTCPSAITF